MLGILTRRPEWSWAAFGKHPVARDYFQIRLEKPLARAYAQWIECGFERTPEDVRRSSVCSWRFWSKGLKKGHLVCGLGKSSGDGVGRPYPLMLLGEGRLDRWEKYWNLLPFVLAPVWEQMEYAASRRIDHLSQLEMDLQRLETPIPAWKGMLKAHGRDPTGPEAQARVELRNDDIQAKARTLERDQWMTIDLDSSGAGTPLQWVGAWHQALKAQLNESPNTVFMGGSPRQASMVFFRRPLTPADFTDLWSV